MKHICVFCASQSGNDIDLIAKASDLGRALAQLGYGLVFGGGRYGLMGAVANGALELNGHVIGIIPKGLTAREPVEHGISELFVVDDILERKRLMIEKSDAFIVLPGGIGTLDELFEIWTGKQVQAYTQPLVIANWNGFYDGLLDFLSQANQHGLVRGEYMSNVMVTNSLPETIDYLRNL